MPLSVGKIGTGCGALDSSAVFCWKVPRLRPLVLQITAVLRWRWFAALLQWNRSTERERAVRLWLCPPQISKVLAWDRIPCLCSDRRLVMSRVAVPCQSFTSVSITVALLQASAAVQIGCSLFWDVTQRGAIVTDVSGHPVCHIFKVFRNIPFVQSSRVPKRR